jgi:hypothetical protein
MIVVALIGPQVHNYWRFTVILKCCGSKQSAIKTVGSAILNYAAN